MRTGATLEDFLKKIAHGDREHVDFALSLLSSDLLITPVTYEEVGANKQTKKIRVVTFFENDKKIIPTFTTEDYLFEWAGSKYQSFSLPGADLSLSLPADAYLRINPGTDHAVELTPEEVKRLSQAAPVSLQTPAPPKEEIAPQETVVASPSSPSTVKVEKTKDQLLGDLRFLLERYSEVTKAYFVAMQREHSEAVIGLVTERMSPERRFLLMADVAEVSRIYFGTAGAMDVYDNVDFKSLNARNIFDNLEPFYERKETRIKKKDSPLREALTKKNEEPAKNLIHEKKDTNVGQRVEKS